MSKEIFRRSYSEFESIVRDIRSGTSTAEFVGGGAESLVWRVAVDGLNYAIKCIKPYSPRGRTRDVQRAAEAKIEAGLRGRDILGLEQICTASPEDGVIVCDFVNGTILSKMSEKDISSVTPAHFIALRRTVSLATKANIEIDGWNTDGDNAFWSPEAGITLIDYRVGNVTYEENLKYAICSLGQAGLELAARFTDGAN